MATFLVKFALPGLTKTQLANTEVGGDLSSLVDKLRGICAQNSQLQSAATNVTYTTVENGTQASATVTCVTVANNATVTLGNVVLTGKTGTPSGQAQWKCGVSAAADGTALKACINAHTTLSTWFVATDNGSGVVTIKSLDYDTRANAYALTSSDGTNLAVTTFSGGALDANSITVAG